MKGDFNGSDTPAEVNKKLQEKISRLEEHIQELERANAELKLAEKSGKNSEAKYRAIVKAFDGLILICSEDYRVEYMNQKYIDRLGFDATGQLCYKAIHNLDDICPDCTNNQVIKGETVRRVTKSSLDGRWYYIVNTPIYNSDGTVSKQSLVLDITGQKVAEDALKDERDRAQKYLDIAGVMFVALDKKGNITLINKKGCRILGYEEQELLGQNWFDKFLPESLRHDVKIVYDELMAGKINGAEYYENPVLTKRGEKRLIAWHNTVMTDEDGTIIGTLSSGEDITERKLAEESLVRSLKTGAEIVQKVPVGFFTYKYEPPNRLILQEANPEATRLTGINIEDWRGKEFNEIWPQARASGITDAFLSPLKTGQTYETEDLHYKDERLEGAYRIRAFRIPGDRLAVAFEDITQRKMMEEALKKSEERFRLIFEHAGTGVALLTTRGKFITSNPTFQKMLGYSNSELRLMHVADYSHPDDYERDRKLFRRLYRNEIKNYKIEKRYIKKNGDIVWAILTVSLIRDSRGNPEYTVGIIEDITERKISEEKLKDAYAEIEKLKDRLQREKVYLEEEIQLDHDFHEIIGQDKKLREALHKIEQVAETDSTVLILGETGTGKELFARAIHNLSKRRDRTLVKVNCAALPPNLIESELFGHEKGAFTGAISKKIGRFEIADGGTLFLDEIGDIPLDLQVKLLRVLQESEFERVGGTKTIKADVRIIAATNRDLDKAVASGRFREDLYHRLNVFPIVIPPLRERKSDIPLLTDHFIRKYSRKIGKKIDKISKGVMNRLMEYEWPGNIRGLENIIERAVIISNGPELELGEWIPSQKVLTEEEKISSLEDLEREYITRTLKITNWRVSGERGAAKILRIKPTTLEAKMKKLGIERPK